MPLTLQVRPDVARALHGQQPATAAAEELLRAVQEFGASLRPVHPGADDPELARHFMVDVPDGVNAQRVADRLRRCGAAEAAYMKPTEEPP